MKTTYQFSALEANQGLDSGDTGRDVTALQSFLGQTGYLGPAYEIGRMCKDTCRAVRAFQRQYGLRDLGGRADPDTLRLAQQPRCGVPDLIPGQTDPRLAPFEAVGCKYDKRDLTFAFQNTTPDIPGNTERQIVRDAFQAWADVTPLRFTEVSPQDGPDFPVAWLSGTHGDGSPFDGPGTMQGNTLAHAFFPPPCGGQFAGAMHFDEGEQWIASGTDGIRLLNVAIHEIGHLLGLAHSNNRDAIMFAFYSPQVDSLRPDDVAGVQSLYGSPPVGDDPPTGSAEVTGSLNGTGDREVWTANIPTGTITVSIVGPSDADFDLYLRVGSAPSTRLFDARGFSADSEETVEFQHPGGTLFLAVESWQGSGDYTLRIDDIPQ